MMKNINNEITRYTFQINGRKTDYRQKLKFLKNGKTNLILIEPLSIDNLGRNKRLE